MIYYKVGSFFEKTASQTLIHQRIFLPKSILNRTDFFDDALTGLRRDFVKGTV